MLLREQVTGLPIPTRKVYTHKNRYRIIHKGCLACNSPLIRLGGFSVVELAVAGSILAVAIVSGISFFNLYITNSSVSRLRDEASTFITKDIELLKSKADRLWSCDPSLTACTGANFSGGSIAFNPPAASCSGKTLASAAATTNPSFASGTTQILVPSQSSQSLKKIIASRTISHQNNIIIARYSVSGPIQISDITYLLPPANGWCP